jgi:glycosyltransferase involved in cell wall biosynthesis
VLAVRPAAPWAAVAAGSELRAGVTVDYVPVRKVPFVLNWLDPWIWASATTAQARRLVGTQPGDIVLDAHFLYPDGVAAVLLGRRLGIPTVITARGSDVNVKCENPIVRRWVRWAAANCSALVTVSRALAVRLGELGIAAPVLEVLPNGVDLQKFAPRDRAVARARFGVANAARVLASVGHLLADKGHGIAIEALAEMPDTTLLIAGDGPDRRSLEVLAVRHGVSERVRFVGLVPHAELADLYSAADALVLASAREGMPNVVLESIACGTPVIATNVGGIGEVVTARAAGVLMRERSVAALREAGAELFAAPPARAETHAFAQRLGWGAVIDKQLGLYRRVLDAAPRSLALGAEAP